MPYYEHLSGRKYRLCTNDPNSVKRKRLYEPVEVPEELAKSERKTKLWLDKELALYVERVDNGEILKVAKQTLDEFMPQWKKGYAASNMGDYTRYMTDNVYRIYIQPAFGQMRLDKITTLHLVNFIADLKRKDGKPMATNTKNNIYKAVKSIFDAAYKWKLIKSNPIDGVDRPTAGKTEKRMMRQRKKSYTRQEAEAVIIALYDLPERWRLYYTGVILGGFRRGEMLAIEWVRNVNFDAGGLYVEKQITFDEEGHKTEDELKTESSEGFVPMPMWYMEQLKIFYLEWKKEKLMCKKWLGGKKQYVFHNGNGEMYYPNTPSLTWRRFLQSKNLPHIRLHDLRHTTAMLLRESGADVKQIQERLRHARAATTTDIYMHDTEEISRDAANKLETLDPMEIRNKKFAPRTAPN